MIKVIRSLLLIGIMMIAGVDGCMELEDDGAGPQSPGIVPDTIITTQSFPLTVDLMEGKSAAILIAGLTVQFTGILGSCYIEENGNQVLNYTCLMKFQGTDGLQTVEMNTHAYPSRWRFGDDSYYEIQLMDVNNTGEGYRLRSVLTYHGGSARL